MVAELIENLGLSKDERLLVGPETSDDAGVFVHEDGTAIVQTVDFFPPVVDEPRIYGRIVAANSLSDVYAMGAKPVAVMNVVGWPAKKLGVDVLAEVLRGAEEKIREAGALLLGGHTMDNSQVLYGLSVTGICEPGRVIRNSTVRAGEVVLLTKPLGSGILTTAAKGKVLDSASYDSVVAVMERLNASAAEVMTIMEAGAGTDVTGFGLLGHLFEMAAGSGVGFEVEAASVPVLDGTSGYIDQGFYPGGSGKNAEYLEGRVTIGESVNENLAKILFDAQTSGGLLFTVAAEKADETLKRLHDGGDGVARIIGRAVPLETLKGPHIHVS